MIEEFRDIKGYEGIYQVSNLGRVKTLSRDIKCRGGFRTIKEKILKTTTGKKGYLQISLSKIECKRKTISIHQLVAIAFLNHVPDGHRVVVDHINNARTDNRVKNLQLITNRENISKEIRGSSKYTGVSRCKKSNKWRADIYFNGKLRYLGCFTNEIDAHHTYQKELKKISIKL